MRRTFVIVSALMALAALPSTASASTISLEAGTLQFTAKAGESNSVVVSVASGVVKVTDGRYAKAGAGCTAVSGGVTCPAALVANVVVLLGDRDDMFMGSALAESVSGGDGIDRIFLNGGDDSAALGNGDDYVDGGPGADALDGGAGRDIAGYAPRTANLQLSIDGIANDGEDGEGDNIATTFETVLAGSGDDQVIGQDANGQTLDGGQGDDVVVGGSGNDTLSGNIGNDFVFGLDGDDTFSERDGCQDQIFGGDGTDLARRDRNLDILSDVERAMN